MSFPKITLSTELATRMVEAKSRILAEIELAQESDEAANRELAALKTRAKALLREISGLKDAALHDVKSAGQLADVERQLQAIQERIQTLSASIVERTGLTLASAQAPFQELLRFYFDALPVAIQAHCAPFFREAKDVRNALPFFECVRILRSLRDQGTALHKMAATENNVAWLFRIFDRALRGQPHLAIDQVVTVEAPAT